MAPWIMTQRWNDLLFLHYALPPEVLRPLVPDVLTLDTYQQRAWVSVTPFWINHLRPPGVPSLPWFSHFAEVNVRTYVTRDGKPGVYFFSLDAGSHAAVWAARKFYHLPYFHADMSSKAQNEEIQYASRRFTGSAEVRAAYKPCSESHRREKGTIEHWLTERYCLYTVHQSKVYRCEIHHLPWPLQAAEAEFQLNTVANASKITLPNTPPLLHFAKQLEVLIWPLRPADDTRV